MSKSPWQERSIRALRGRGGVVSILDEKHRSQSCRSPMMPLAGKASSTLLIDPFLDAIQPDISPYGSTAGRLSLHDSAAKR